MKDTQTPGRGTTTGSSKVWTDEERAAMVEHAKEQKKAARRGAEPDGESDVLAKIAEMPDADRAIAERIHAIVEGAGAGPDAEDLLRDARVRQGRQGDRLLPGRGEVQVAVLDARVQRRRDPRRRHHVADVLRPRRS